MTLTYATNYLEARRIALQNTPGESLEILEKLTRYVAIDPPSGVQGEYCYRDVDVTGPISATWREAQFLGMLAKKINAYRILEIGCAQGWTTAHMARHAPVVCIDPFIETATGRLGMTVLEQEERFLENMEILGFESSRVQLCVDYSPEAIPSLPKEGPFDLVFVDGWHHDGQPVKDVLGVLPYVSDESVIVLHDFNIPDVQNAGHVLVDQGWRFTGFATACALALFWRGAESFPQWWKGLAPRMTAVQP